MRLLIPTCRILLLAAATFAVLVAAPRSAPGAGGSGTTRAVSRSTFGTSLRGRRLLVYTRGAADARRNVLIVGCIHGNECAGTAIVRQLRRRAAPRGVRLWLITSANPDGQSRGTRQNARRVDLNRNFPFRWRRAGRPGDVYYPGRRRASEPETRALILLIRRIRPDATIWYHQHMRAVDTTGHQRRLVRLYARRSGLPARQLPSYRGTATSWQNHAFASSTAFVVELPAGRLPRAPLRRHVGAALAVARALTPR